MNRKINLGNIKIYVEDSCENMSLKAADVFCEELKKKPNGVYGFATGSTPLGLYQELIKRCEKKEVDFSQITTFNLDEYYPIQKDNPQSYDYFMKQNLFNHINIDQNKIHIPNGEAENASEECAKYEEEIKSHHGIDLQVLGIGENGHIGFNEPSDCFTNATNCIDLTKSTIRANARFFKSTDEVPKQALTMGIKTIMQSKKILLLVNSPNKSDILKEALFGNITPKVPASILQLHHDVTVVMDGGTVQI